MLIIGGFTKPPLKHTALFKSDVITYPRRILVNLYHQKKPPIWTCAVSLSTNVVIGIYMVMSFQNKLAGSAINDAFIIMI